MYAGSAFTKTSTPSSCVGNLLATKSLFFQLRVVGDSAPPKRLTQVLGAIVAEKLAAFSTPLAWSDGADWMLPKTPWAANCLLFALAPPAVKYNDAASPPLPPLPNTKAQRPGTVIGLPFVSFRVPISAPVFGSNA